MSLATKRIEKNLKKFNNYIEIKINKKEKKISTISKTKIKNSNQLPNFTLKKRKVSSLKDFKITPDKVKKNLDQNFKQLFEKTLPNDKKLKEISNKNSQIKNWLNKPFNSHKKKSLNIKLIMRTLNGFNIGGITGLFLGMTFGGIIGVLTGTGPLAVIGAAGIISAIIFGAVGMSSSYKIFKTMEFNKISNEKLYINFYNKKNNKILENNKKFFLKNKKIFSKFFCCLKKDIIDHPVRYPNIDAVYEKELIEEHLKKNPKGINSPCNKKHMDIKKLRYDFDYYPKLLNVFLLNSKELLDDDFSENIETFINKFTFNRSIALKQISDRLSYIFSNDKLRKKFKLDKKNYYKKMEYLKKENNFMKFISKKDNFRKLISQTFKNKKNIKKISEKV